MEEKTPLLQAPTLILCGARDPFSYPRMKPLSEAIKGSKMVVIDEGMVPMVDQLPEEFARAVLRFLDEN
jgi:pimeloyl-ACP methyl ester carboxylesterase